MEHINLPSAVTLQNNVIISLTNLAGFIQARLNCIESKNDEWLDQWEAAINQVINYLPSGSGLDTGCNIDLENSTANKIIITTSFHHMNEAGGYINWTDHKVIATPSFTNNGYDLKITGKDQNNIKDYLYEIFYTIFTF